MIYGSALVLLFSISTAFHCVFYTNKDLLLKDILHRMDRAMIYVFIAGSYFPWLNLGHTQHPYIVCVLKWLIWVLAALGIIYQQVCEEKFLVNLSLQMFSLFSFFTKSTRTWRQYFM